MMPRAPRTSAASAGPKVVKRTTAITVAAAADPRSVMIMVRVGSGAGVLGAAGGPLLLWCGLLFIRLGERFLKCTWTPRDMQLLLVSGAHSMIGILSKLNHVYICILGEKKTLNLKVYKWLPAICPSTSSYITLLRQF